MWSRFTEGTYRTLARDLQFHPFNGITGFTQGNGIATTKGFDIAGHHKLEDW